MSTMLQTEHLTFAYPAEEGESAPTAALEDVTLSVEKGSFVVVLGHNGSGKSTLAKQMNAVLLPCGGTVYVDGMDTKQEALLLEIRRRVGMVFQNPDNQIVANVVEEDVAFAPENLGIPTGEIRRRVDDALAAVGMSEFTRHAPHLLSGGQKQRVAIAGVIAMAPECVVLDEATAMLDPSGRREVLSAIRALNRERGITVIIITHQMSVIEQICHRVAILDAGQVAEIGPVEEIFSNPQTPAGRRLVSPDVALPVSDWEGPMARIAFNGNMTEEPIIASLAMDKHIKVSILGADTRNVDGKAFGTMLISLPEDEDQRKTVMDYLNGWSGVTAEEVRENV